MANIQKIGSNTWRISKMYKRVRYTKIVHRKPSKAEAERLMHIAELIGRVCEAKRPHSVSERSARALS